MGVQDLWLVVVLILAVRSVLHISVPPILQVLYKSTGMYFYHLEFCLLEWLKLKQNKK